MSRLLAAALLLAGVPASATTKPGLWSWGPELGWAQPGGDIGDATDGGPLVGVQAAYRFTPKLSFVSDLELFLWKNNENDTSTVVSSAKTISLAAGGRYDFPEQDLLVPYAFGGLGLGYTRSSVDFAPVLESAGSVDADDDDFNVGFMIGAGAEKDFDKYTLGLEFKYRTFELGLASSMFSAAVRLTWPILPPPPPRVIPGSYGL